MIKITQTNKEALEVAVQALREIGVIDPHAHCRAVNKTDEQGQKATISEVLRQAERLGILVICDMPNTDPAAINEKVLLEHLKAAKDSESNVKYMAWVGLTCEPGQVAEVVSLWQRYPEVVGLKMFAGESTGNMAIIEKKDQQTVYKTLAALGYTGPIAVHCEEESYIDLGMYNTEEPWTWAVARPSVSEVSSIEQQIRIVRETGFKGHLHICHVSSCEAVDMVNNARRIGMKISCGITPQMLLYSLEKLRKMGKTKALLLKCNPPIRSEANRKKLIEYLREGKIDAIETDHAPHTIKDKMEKSSSGVMSMFLLPGLYIELLNWGFEKRQIEDLIRNNALRIFTKIQT